VSKEALVAGVGSNRKLRGMRATLAEIPPKRDEAREDCGPTIARTESFIASLAKRGAKSRVEDETGEAFSQGGNIDDGACSDLALGGGAKPIGGLPGGTSGRGAIPEGRHKKTGVVVGDDFAITAPIGSNNG
jgi:hypothetical protein